MFCEMLLRFEPQGHLRCDWKYNLYVDSIHFKQQFSIEMQMRLWIYLTGKWQVVCFLKVSLLMQTLHTSHWPPHKTNKSNLSKSSLISYFWVKAVWKMLRTTNWVLVLNVIFFSSVVWIIPVLTGNYSLCAVSGGQPWRPGFGWEGMVQHHSNCRAYLRKYNNMGTTVYHKYCWI